MIGNGILTIDFSINYTVPSIRKMSDQLILNIWHVEWYRSRHDHCTGIVSHPQFMNYSCHEAKNATCPLETFEGCPIFIKAVKDFRMNRIAGNHSIPIIHFFGIKREVCCIFLIHIAESCANNISCFGVFAFQEKPSTYNFKAFVCCNRFPNGFHTAKCVLNSLKSCFTSISSNFYI